MLPNKDMNTKNDTAKRNNNNYLVNSKSQVRIGKDGSSLLQLTSRPGVEGEKHSS